MLRPRQIDLREPDQPWQSVPMPGASHDLDLVPLESDGDALTMLGRFPAGFGRAVPCGYLVAEDLVVLDGRLELEGRTYGPATLVHIPARFIRTSMATPDGCLVLAWFSGPAIICSVAELRPVVATGIRSVDLAAVDAETVFETGASRWRVVSASGWPSAADGVDLDLTAWARAGADWSGELPERLFARVPRLSFD
ncbi:MAG TPA: hypothetical protein VEX15_22870 [Nocardioidaceae bacterium]|nr:hypothetical protein [Nocardioidaceae bacterium]